MHRQPTITFFRVFSLVVVVALIFGCFLLLYRVARKVVLDEIRYQAMGVAIATAAGLTADELQAIQGPADRERESFQRIQAVLSAVSRFNPDVRYTYVMRRATGPDAKPSDYVYVVDQAAEDANRNGAIDPDEVSEDPGAAYDASDLPAMVAAWREPTADSEVSPDPPYPDLLSGYAPVRDANGQTVAIVGADVTAGTVGAKLLILRVASGLVWFAMSAMAVITMLLYMAQRDLVLEREQLIAELRNALASVQTLSGLLPICSSCKRIRDDHGAWERLETYVGQRSSAEFSHSICPECAARLYPDVAS